MPTILVVDDRSPNRQFLVTLLSHFGHYILEAGDGAEALAVARADHPDLVIADILMPTMDGFEFVRQLRADPAIADIQVIFYTAHYLEPEARALASACGVSSILTKPCEPEVVLSTVDAALGLSRLSVIPDEPEGWFEREHQRLLTDKIAQKANELRRSNERLTALIDLSLQLGSENEPRRLLQSLCHAARSIIGARYAIVGILEENGQGTQHIFTSGMEAAKAARLGSPAPLDFIIKSTGRENRCRRAVNPEGNPADIGLSSSYPPVHSWLAAQIASPNRVYGWLDLIDKVGAEEFNLEDERLVEILAAQAGRIYENSTMYLDIQRHAAELEREISERQRAEQRQEILVAVNRGLAVSATIDEAFHRVLKALGENMSWELGSAWILDRQANVLRNAQMWKPPGVHFPEWERLNKEAVFEPGAGMPGQVWLKGKSDWIADMTQHSVLRASLAAREGLRSALGFPIVFEKRVLGVFEFLSSVIREPDDDLLSMFSGIGSVIGQFVERKQAEQALRESEERFRQITENMNEVIFLTNSDQSEMLYISPSYEKVWGFSCASIYENPRSWLDSVLPEDRPAARDLMERGMRGENAVQDYRITGPDNAIRRIRVCLYPIRDRAGQIIRTAGTAEDITERHNLEQQFRQAQKMEAIGNLAGGVAHDFNNLITVINGYSELLLNRLKGDDRSCDQLREIKKAGERAATLTRQLLAFSRKQVLAPVVLDLNAIVEEMGKMLRRLIGENIELVTLLEPAVSRVKADPGQIEQVILNLVVNARDAMPGGGHLTIETRNVELDQSYASTRSDVRAGSYVLMSVSDTGCGMSEEVKSHIYEPFFTTKGKGEGTGLGLATVYGIVKQSEGHVEVYSEEGLGTTFKIYLPHTEDPPGPARGPATERSLPAGTETILLVEDEEAVRRISRITLESCGYAVFEAVNGAEAFRLAESYPQEIHLLVTDVVMPQMGGRQLADALKAVRPSLKILYVSGYTDDSAVRHGVLERTVDFLHKPFSQSSLAHKVRQVLDAPAGAGGRVETESSGSADSFSME